jgi:glycosyltransferase involved in cell wall biosynthesis
MKLLVTTQAVDKNDPILGFFIDWLQEFAKHFERIDVICLRKGEYELPPHVHVHSLGKEEGESRLKYVYRFYKYFTHVFFTVRVDYVFYHMGAIYNIMGAPFYFLRKLLKTKFYWWKAHGHINFIGRTALHFVDKVLTASTESFPLNTHKRAVIGHAICVDRQNLKRGFIGARLPQVSLVCVGRVVRIKNIEIAIDTCHLLKQKGFDPHLEIIGPTEDSRYLNELKKRIAMLEIDDQVNFHGGVNYEVLKEKFHNFDLLLHPSDTGSIDKVVLEAMVAGTIPISQCSAYQSLSRSVNRKICVQNNRPEEYTRVISDLFNGLTPDEYDSIVMTLVSTVRNEHAIDTLTQRLFTES